MKISINIQSYKRAGDVLTLGLDLKSNLWVHEFEADEYKKLYGDIVKILPDSLRGNLPKVKNYILEAEKENDAILFLDDDILKVGYFENKIIHYIKGNQLTAFIEKYSLLCKEWGFYLWGINVNPDKQNYCEYTPFSTLSYISSSFACFLKGNKLRYDERFPLKEDYDMTIQQCNKYRGLLRVNKAFYIKKSAENIGGCATYRNLDREREQFDLLQKKWGSRIVKKERLGNSRSHSTDKVRKIDINPIIHSPIRGV
jgi:hypothetical protein